MRHTIFWNFNTGCKSCKRDHALFVQTNRATFNYFDGVSECSDYDDLNRCIRCLIKDSLSNLGYKMELRKRRLKRQYKFFIVILKSRGIIHTIKHYQFIKSIKD